ncbi:hypothetical protein EYF80_055326 [Liparis tanakae]|uniref:Uncharacterized protein n=1 Tax=Liparis tanakae TaxID=230148 RepID=A0A4Z2F059_9TELE|nr:hypothetical protein EYF80_055326 [Liparis tanakae]
MKVRLEAAAPGSCGSGSPGDTSLPPGFTCSSSPPPPPHDVSCTCSCRSTAWSSACSALKFTEPF